MMEEKQETVADIVAEMRDRKDMLRNAISSAPLCYPVDDMQAKVEILDEFIDRIEAERQREIGNGAKMREALVALSEWVRVVKNNPKDTTAIECAEFVEETIKAAIAEPAHNCDRFNTLEDALAGWREVSPDESVPFDNWLFAEAKGDAK